MNAPLLAILPRTEIDGYPLLVTEWADKPIRLHGYNTTDGYDITGVFLSHHAPLEENNLIDWFTSAQIKAFENECEDRLGSYAELMADWRMDFEQQLRRDARL